ncbi:uncharacterized protein LOC114360013 [Ostrinia furnacalis]|uniref:uncharacterized protein LOC114360013 n=1 Tax=Ostrinia furnacalis TaxID=93504 RepID=UPI001038959D|nr:uncharacterized protein LOC114360013 [Ostrinia furnacalis]
MYRTLHYVKDAAARFLVSSRTILRETPTNEEGPIVAIISQWIHPRQITQSDQACTACWLRAQRTLRRQQLVDEARNINEELTTCVNCNKDLLHSNGHLLRNEDENVINIIKSWILIISTSWIVFAMLVGNLQMKQHGKVLSHQRLHPNRWRQMTLLTHMNYRKIIMRRRAIIGYCCNCIVGLRTVGCCSHVMSIVWYLAYARHLDNISPPAQVLDGILVRINIE